MYVPVWCLLSSKLNFETITCSTVNVHSTHTDTIQSLHLHQWAFVKRVCFSFHWPKHCNCITSVCVLWTLTYCTLTVLNLSLIVSNLNLKPWKHHVGTYAVRSPLVEYYCNCNCESDHSSTLTEYQQMHISSKIATVLKWTVLRLKNFQHTILPDIYHFQSAALPAPQGDVQAFQTNSHISSRTHNLNVHKSHQ